MEFWKIRILENYLKMKICFGKLNFKKKKYIYKMEMWATRGLEKVEEKNVGERKN